MINESEIVKKIEKDKNIRYFKLPEDNGWNSGRAVLISQVQTEYFVTCDGDFIFNGATRKDIHYFDLYSISYRASDKFNLTLESSIDKNISNKDLKHCWK